MEIRLYAKNVGLTAAFQEYVQKKIGAATKIGQNIISCRADLSRDQHHHKGDVFRFEVNLNIPGQLLRVVEYHGDARAAVDIVADTLLHQLRKSKGKKIAKTKRLARLFKRKRGL